MNYLAKLDLKNWIGLLVLGLCLAWFWGVGSQGDVNPGTFVVFGIAAIFGGVLFIRQHS